VNVVVPAALTSAPAPSLVQIPAIRVQMKEVVSEDVVMPTTAAQALHGKLNCIIKGDVTGLATAPSEGEERGESISDAFRLNALPLTPGLSKLEPVPLAASFHLVISPLR
jgi:hypothetical protein